MAWSSRGLVWQVGIITAAQAATFPTGTEPELSGIMTYLNIQRWTCPEQDLLSGRRISALARSLHVFLARPPHLFLCQHHPRV